ncbi:hypothetical protein TNCT_242271 [Trichonephila clavata]|uniref:Uncharacterized protein n=1 Tax=Trichonephila clavata TaxID=2740835 RepID=A0A8X6FSA4_TRICU|nr:hypothetical protein TNCT_242271 [Trichonephila clavata]
MARLDKMVSGRVKGNSLEGFALNRKGGKACDARGLKLIPQDPNNLCGRRNDRNSIRRFMNERNGRISSLRGSPLQTDLLA